jgi:hypothetical protein
MVMLGIDAHERTHTVVAVDDLGRQVGVRTTTATTPEDHLELLRWAARFGSERVWAVEDGRHLSRRLERDELDPTWDPPARSLTRLKNLDAVAARLATIEGMTARIAADILVHARALTVSERALEREITTRVRTIAPTLLETPGVGARTGNRQLNAAIHRIAVTQKRCHDEAKTYLERRTALGNSNREALRALKRRISDVVFRAPTEDANASTATCLAQAA